LNFLLQGPIEGEMDGFENAHAVYVSGAGCGG
jgi:hypothetical protein